jgi:tRNA A-37 threonylcarbamoyl transferase component Bud32
MNTAKDRMFDELRIARVRWQIAPAWADRIGSGATTVEAMLRDCRLHVVKHGSHRTVYRIDRPEQSFYLKRYRSGGLLSSLRRLLRASNSWREYRKALELERRGVPSVLPVAVGQTSSRVTSGDDFLLTAAISNAMSLETFVEQHLPTIAEPRRSALRRRLIDALGAMTAEAHRVGAFHDDLHSGNVLIEADDDSLAAGSALRLHWADVPGVSLTGPLSWRRSRANLVVLNWDWQRRATPVERLRFLAIYRRHRTDIDCGSSPAAEIARRTERYAWRLMSSRDKRSLAVNRDFHQGATPKSQWWAVRDVDTDDVNVLAQALADGFDPEQLKLGGKPIELRSFKPSRQSFLGRRAAVRSARHAWRSAHALLARGIATPRPMLLVVTQGNATLTAPCLVFASTTQQTLRAALAKSLTDTGRIGTAVGDLLGRLHAWGYLARTMSAESIHVIHRDDGIRAEWIDATCLEPSSAKDRRLQLRNLVELATSVGPESWTALNTDDAVLRAYARQWEIDRPDVTELASELALVDRRRS